MSVGELKEYLDKFDDKAEVFYFDAKSVELKPLKADVLAIEAILKDEE